MEKIGVNARNYCGAELPMIHRSDRTFISRRNIFRKVSGEV